MFFLVPRDLFYITPSYVPPEQLPENYTAHPKLIGRHRKGMKDVAGNGYTGRYEDFKMPTNPSIKFFTQLGTNTDLKMAVCDKTFLMVARRNDDIYGEETRANEDLLKKCCATGQMPVS